MKSGYSEKFDEDKDKNEEEKLIDDSSDDDDVHAKFDL